MKYLALLLFAMVSQCSFSQEGKATYFQHYKMQISLKSDKGMPDSQKEAIQKQLESSMQREFTLSFNRSESTYKEVPHLNSPQPQVNNGIEMQIVSSVGDTYYKNIANGTYINKTDLMGKVFSIQDSLPKRDWQLTSETKKIGNYTCYKATYTYTSTIKSFGLGEPEEEKEETRTVTAWYTPEIPVSNGPQDYQGLPGLILEVHSGDLTLVCNEITLNPETSLSIEAPKGGKEISQSEYEALEEKKMKQFIEQHSGNSNRDGDTKIISISFGS